MSEYFPKKAVALTMVLGLGLTACGGSGAAESSHASSHTKQGPTIPDVRVKYFQNGSRELIMSNINRSHSISGPDGVVNPDDTGYNPTTAINDIYQFCDGLDLVEVTEGWTGNVDDSDSTISSSLDRSVNYPGCADGRLTPSDFRPVSAAETH